MLRQQTQIYLHMILKKKEEGQKIIPKIATLNVQNLSEAKLNILINYMKKEKIDIMGLTETHRMDREIKFMNLVDHEYTIINHNIEDIKQSAGLTLLIHRKWEKHTYNIEKYGGRIIVVDFSFKKNKKLRIILIYNKSGMRKI